MVRMVRSALRLAGVATLLLASTAAAQSSSSLGSAFQHRADVPADVPLAATSDTIRGYPMHTLPAGPTLDAASVALRAPAPTPVPADSATALLQRRAGQGFGQSEILMIVGGATFLVGAIIGDDAGTIVMIGGAAIGLYGLYQFLQEQ